MLGILYLSTSFTEKFTQRDEGNISLCSEAFVPFLIPLTRPGAQPLWRMRIYGVQERKTLLYCPTANFTREKPANKHEKLVNYVLNCNMCTKQWGSLGTQVV